ncbi:MAG: hypothetical protein AAF657_04850 [Acidobacteriota bacterium]
MHLLPCLIVVIMSLAWVGTGRIQAQSLVLSDSLGEDQLSEQVTLWIDGQVAARFMTDAERPEERHRIDLAPGPHRYRIEGKTALDGQEMTIHGAGLIEAESSLRARLKRARSGTEVVEVLFSAISAMHEDVQVYEAMGNYLASVHRGEPIPDAEFRQAETRLGINLPHEYEEILAAVGAFRLEGTGAAELFAPADLGSVARYMAQVWADNGGDCGEEELQKKYAEKVARGFRGSDADLVLGRFLLEPLILRPGKRCPQGQEAYAMPEDAEGLVLTFVDSPHEMSYREVLGETRCLTFRSAILELVQSYLSSNWHDELFLAFSAGETYSFYRSQTLDDKIWLRFEYEP